GWPSASGGFRRRRARCFVGNEEREWRLMSRHFVTTLAVMNSSLFGTTRYVGGDGGESNSPSRTLHREPLRACPMVCRRSSGRASALCRTIQSRVPRSGLAPDYATLVRIAASLHDASTTREAEAASTLTLPPKRRGRE